MIFDKHLKNNFSHDLAKNSKRFIVRYEDVTSRGLPGLGIKLTSDTFHWEEKCESLKTELNKWDRLIMAFF